MFLKELQTEIYAEHIRFVNAGIGQQLFSKRFKYSLIIIRSTGRHKSLACFRHKSLKIKCFHNVVTSVYDLFYL